jgi:hypothetical protein
VGTYAWFEAEPTRELAWYEMPGAQRDAVE